jgi:hypothetical protein
VESFVENLDLTAYPTTQVFQNHFKHMEVAVANPVTELP